MPYDPFKHHRRSIRLKDYDYAQAGAYFVTIVIRNHECLLGDIVDGEMRLNECGAIVQSGWNDLPAHYPNVELDAFVVMPNHVHGVIVLADVGGVDVRRGEVSSPNPGGGIATNPGGGTPPLPTVATYQPTIGQIVGYFKYQSTKRINLLRDIAGAPVWQRNYFEHIVRSENALERIRAYIDANPANWAQDEENLSIRKSSPQ